MIPKKFQLKNTIKHPTSIIVGGANRLGVEIADSLIKQGGYVVIIDAITNENVSRFDSFSDNAMLSILDYTSIPHLEEDIRRLDYVFYFNHESENFRDEISTSEFLTISNYLDAALALASKFEARFLLTTSIKAHQVLFQTDDSAYKMSMTNKYTKTYSNMEMQRYSEGLVMEYFEKAELSSRIIRLGEVIGDGMNMRSKTVFTDLLSRAVNGTDLLLRNDGLENEWFVHILDAAYGIIKAQFSKEAEGQVFSVCYDNTYTHLSIAYKIQELENDSGDIKFVESDSMAPPLKIHKPAPNLSKIGWMPRISFDRAVTQALASAKIHYIEENMQKVSESEEVGNLKSFLNIAGNSKNGGIHLSEGEMKQEQLREAYKQIKLTKSKRVKSRYEKINDSFWGFFKSMAGMFSFIGKMSPVQFGIFILFLLVFTISYFLILSPVLYITRNLVELYPSFEAIEASLETNDFETIKSETDVISQSINNISDSLATLKIPSSILNYEDEVGEIDQFLEYYNDTSEGLSNVSQALAPYNQYIREFENNLTLRKSNDGYLSLSSEGKSYIDLLGEIENNEIFYDKGIEIVNRSIRQVSENTLPRMPEFLEKEFIKFNEFVLSLSDLSDTTSFYLSLPDLLGNSKPVTYMLIVLDNTRPTPIGGEISSYALVTIQEGGIRSIELKSAESLNLLNYEFTESNIREINARRFGFKTTNNAKITDFESIADEEIFLNSITRAISSSTDVNIDAVGVITLESFSDLISNIENDVSVNGISFKDSDVLTSLVDAQLGNESVENKKETISELFAAILPEIINSWQSNHSNIENVVSKLLENNSVSFQSTDRDLGNILNNKIDVKNSDTYINVGLISTDPKIVNTQTYPNITLTLETTITNEFKIINNLSVRFPNIGSSSEVSVCLPDSVRLSSIVIDSEVIPIERSRLNINGDEICAVAQVINETQMNVYWEDETYFATTSDKLNLTFGITDVNGARTELDHVVKADREILVADSEGIEINPNLGSIEILNHDIIKNLIISRR